jgi:hypothetical protein
MLESFRGFWQKLFKNLFKGRKSIKLGLYGPPNSGKSTLANKIALDLLGQTMSSVSAIPHETREVTVQENLSLKTKDGKELQLNLVDTPGIATKIDFEDFLKFGMPEAKAKKRAKEATRGVIDAIKWLDEMDAVVVVLDATEDPYSQVNITILGNLAARNIPVLIAANKTDLKKSNIRRVEAAFPQYPVIPISAKFGKNIDQFYEKLFEVARR